MLRLRRCRQPTTARDTLRVDESLQEVFCDHKQMLESCEARVLLCRRAVDIRPTHRIVLDDGGSNFS